MLQRGARKYFEGHIVWKTTHSLQRYLTNKCIQGSSHVSKVKTNIFGEKKNTNRPCLFCGRPKSLKDFSQLVKIWVSSKERYLQQRRHWNISTDTKITPVTVWTSLWSEVCVPEGVTLPRCIPLPTCPHPHRTSWHQTGAQGSGTT